MTTEMREEERLRNPLCIRWDDEGHKRLTDTAWRMRLPASRLVRQLVDEGLLRLEKEQTDTARG